MKRISSIEIKKLYNQFVDYCKKFRTETRGTYIRALKAFVDWTSQNDGCGFQVTDIEAYKNYLLQKKKLKPVSVSTYLTALRVFCKYLVDKNLIAENPADKVAGFERPAKHSRKILTIDEVNKLFNSVDKSDDRGKRDYAMIKLMLGCGLSEIELVYANIFDIQKENSHTMMLVRGKGHTKKDEKVFLKSDVKKAVDDYLKTRKPYKDNEPLFLSAGNKIHGKRMTTRGIRERINYYLKKAGIKRNQARKITPYSLRHTAAVLLAKSGASAEQIQKRMRLGTLTTAMIYYNKKDK